ncbi:MAG: hypothetical protein WC655_14670 [Candidatus Hydrogenedentales bacterium]|jgi:hypothetical protein
MVDKDDLKEWNKLYPWYRLISSAQEVEDFNEDAEGEYESAEYHRLRHLDVPRNSYRIPVTVHAPANPTGLVRGKRLHAPPG